MRADPIVMRNILRAALVTVLALAPLPFGSVQREVSLGLVAACWGLGACWIVWRGLEGRPPLPWRDPILAAGLLVALFGVLQIVPLPRSILTTVSPRAAELRGTYEPPDLARPAPPRPISLDPDATRRSVLKWIACLLVALVAFEVAGRSTGRRMIVSALIAGGSFQALYGLAEYFSGRQHIFGYAKRYYTEVATGTFINRNHFAGYLELTLPLVVAVLAAAVGRLDASGRGRSVGERLATASGRDLFRCGALLTLAVVMATALVCSRSRMAILSTALAFLCMGMTLARSGRGRGFAIAGAVVVGGTFLLFSQGSAGAPVLERFLQAAAEFQGNIGRWEMWSQAAAMARAFPVSGVGLGAFGRVFPAFRTAGAGVALDHAHNDYLELLAEAGLAGTLVCLVALAWVVTTLRLRTRGRPDFGPLGHGAVTGLTALGLHSLADFNLEIPGNAVTIAALVGIVLCWRRAPAPVLAGATGDPAAAAPWRASLATVAALGLAAAALVAGNRDPEGLFRSAARIEKAATKDLQAAQSGRGEDAPAAAEAAVSIETRLDNAIELQVRGLRGLPTSATGHLGLARLEILRCAARREESSEACADPAWNELRSAVLLGPMDAAVHAQVARILLAGWELLDDRQRAEGLAIIERAAAMNPKDRDLGGAALARAGAAGG